MELEVIYKYFMMAQLIDNFADDADIIFRSDDGSGGIVEYFKLDGLNENIKFSVPTVHIDNKKAFFGTSGDLEIYHDGSSSSFINNYTGHLYFRNYADDKDIYFQCDDGNGSLTNYFYIDGSLADGTNVGTRFPDQSIILLGSGSGFQDGAQIYHNGSKTIINNYVGDLHFNELADDGDIIFSSDDGSGGLATYYTVDGGVGRNVFSKDIVAGDNVYLRIGNATDGDLQIFHNGSNSHIQNHTGDLYVENLADDKDVIFRSDDGSGGFIEYLRLDGGDVRMYASREWHKFSYKKRYWDFKYK